MLATTCSRLAVKPLTRAGMDGAWQLSLAKLFPTQAGSGRPSMVPSDLQIGANGLSPAGTARDTVTGSAGCGVALATNAAPAAARAATRTTPVPILFNISLWIDAAAADHAFLDQVAEFDHPLIGELLHPLTAIGLGGEDIALGVGDDAVDRIELSRLPAAAAEPVQLLHALAVENVDVLVGTVRDIHELL